MEHHARLLNRPDPVEVSMRRRLAYGPTEGTRCGRSSSHSRGAATRRQWWRLLDPDDRACEESKGLRFRSVGPAAWGIAPGWARALALVATGIVVLGFVTTVRARVTPPSSSCRSPRSSRSRGRFPPTRRLLAGERRRRRVAAAGVHVVADTSYAGGEHPWVGLRPYISRRPSACASSM
jgi:hypothetical protein